MKNQVKVFAIAASAFVLGMGLNNYAMSDMTSKIAVVDLNKVVSESKQVGALKKEQMTKMNDLQAWLKVARADVEKQKTQEGREKLSKKYEADFVKKREDIQKNYAAKLKSIDKSITGTIETEAKAKGYDLVLTKSVVLYGGEDITKAIAAAVK